MSVDDWAVKRAEMNIRTVMSDSERAFYRLSAIQTTQSFVDALLSDEAVEATQRLVSTRDRQITRSDLRAVLQAAVRAVTEGESE